jgi:hypothetical protein
LGIAFRTSPSQYEEQDSEAQYGIREEINHEVAGCLREGDLRAAGPEKGGQYSKIHTACRYKKRSKAKHKNGNKTRGTLDGTVAVIAFVAAIILQRSLVSSRKGKVEYKDSESTNADKRADQVEDWSEHANSRGHAEYDVCVNRENDKSNDAT